jgi:hypothetical protein
VALGAARAAAGDRRVAIADLVDAHETLGPLVGGAAGAGITDSFVHGVSLNDVARPAADGTPGLFILPRGAAALSTDVLASERWRRLAVGFGEAQALLLVVARLDEPRLDALVRQTDGVVAVGADDVPMAWRVIAQVSDQRVRAPAVPRPVARRSLKMMAGIAAVAAFALALSWWRPWQSSVAPRRSESNARPGALAKTGALATTGALAQAGGSVPAPAAAIPRRTGPPVDTVRVADPVNPPDSAVAAQFAVELVATNTAAGANLWIRERGDRLPGLTVSPVVMGAARARWHRVIAGAWRERTGADSLLRALRDAGVLRRGAGVVVQMPLALLVEADVSRAAAAARLGALAARGVPAYALLQDDGTVRLYAGAFETAAAAVSLDADLRGAGLHPALAYRTGRTF